MGMWHVPRLREGDRFWATAFRHHTREPRNFDQTPPLSPKPQGMKERRFSV